MTAVAKRPSARSKLTLADHQRLSRHRHTTVPLRRITLVTRAGNVALLDCGHKIAVGPHGAHAFHNGDLHRIRCERCAS